MVGKRSEYHPAGEEKVITLERLIHPLAFPLPKRTVFSFSLASRINCSDDEAFFSCMGIPTFHGSRKNGNLLVEGWCKEDRL